MGFEARDFGRVHMNPIDQAKAILMLAEKIKVGSGQEQSQAYRDLYARNSQNWFAIARALIEKQKALTEACKLLKWASGSPTTNQAIADFLARQGAE